MLLNELPNDGFTIERKTSVNKFIEQSGQRQLRDLQQNINILREPRPAAEHRGQATEQRISNTTIFKHFAENLDSGNEITGQGIRGFRHVASRTW